MTIWCTLYILIPVALAPSYSFIYLFVSKIGTSEQLIPGTTHLLMLGPSEAIRKLICKNVYEWALRQIRQDLWKEWPVKKDTDVGLWVTLAKVYSPDRFPFVRLSIPPWQGFILIVILYLYSTPHCRNTCSSCSHSVSKGMIPVSVWKQERKNQAPHSTCVWCLS